MKSFLIKREGGSELVMKVMVWALMSLLGTRLFLELSNYPQIGGGSWHIAHVVWGGLLMCSSIILMLSYQGKRARELGAILGGVGVGLFIDELGKYISSENDYFFEPAVMFIYVFFIILFLTYRYLERERRVDDRNLLSQALARLEEVVENDLEKREREEVIGKLNKVVEGGKYPIAMKIKEGVEESLVIEDKDQNKLQKTWFWLRRSIYRRIFKRKLVMRVLLLLAAAYLLSNIWDFVYLTVNFSKIKILEWWEIEMGIDKDIETKMFLAMSFFNLITGLFFGLGIWKVWRRKRRSGIYFFQLGLLINIFLSSVFKFYFEQVSAVFGLAFSIIVYIGLGKMKEELDKKTLF